MSFITDMGTVLGRLIKSDLKLEHMKKESFYELLDLLKSENNILRTTLDSLTFNDRRDLKNKIEAGLSGKEKVPAFSLYKQWRGKLSGPASTMENKASFEAILHTARAFSTILEDMGDNVDRLFEDKNMTLSNTRVSHLVVFGVLKNCYDFQVFGKCLFGILTTSISGELGTMNVYRVKQVENSQEVVNTINRVCKKEGSYSFLQAVDRLIQENSNFLLFASGKVSFINMITPKAFTKTGKELASIGTTGFPNIFRVLGEKWNLYQTKRLKLKELDKNWMESRAALLKLDLEGMDKNTPEYVRLAHIITNYEDKITILNREILKLEGR